MSKELPNPDRLVEYRERICALRQQIANLSGNHPKVKAGNQADLRKPTTNAAIIADLERQVAELEELIRGCEQRSV
jgi:polyhydroxyalkanoate synthesis regulator phasin